MPYRPVNYVTFKNLYKFCSVPILLIGIKASVVLHLEVVFDSYKFRWFYKHNVLWRDVLTRDNTI